MSIKCVSDAVIKDIGEAYLQLRDRVPELEAENKRLREALQEAESDIDELNNKHAAYGKQQFNAGLEAAAKEVLKVGGPGYEYLAASIRALKGES